MTTYTQTCITALVSTICVQGDTSRCLKPPVDFKTKVQLKRPDQNGTSVLKSTEGLKQGDVSPCISELRELPFMTSALDDGRFQEKPTK